MKGLEEPKSTNPRWSAESRSVEATTRLTTNADRSPERQGIFADSGGSHAEVIDALTRSRETNLRSMGYRLNQCGQLRVKADYHIETDFPVEDAEMAGDQCEKIWTTVQSLDK